MMQKTDFSKLTTAELFSLKDKYAKEGDVESLLEIAIFQFGRGSLAMYKFLFPEISYYYGLMRRLDDLQLFLNENWLPISMLPSQCKELAQNLAVLGYKYPELNMDDSSYLDEALRDPETHEVVDTILRIKISKYGNRT
jgi:hypothetical protein